MKNHLKSLFWHLVLTGFMLVFMGIAILYYPAIIVYLVAALFIAMGLVYFSIAGRIRNVEKNLEQLLKPFRE